MGQAQAQDPRGVVIHPPEASTKQAKAGKAHAAGVVAAIVAGALRRNPEHRYPDAHHMSIALHKAAKEARL